MPKANASCQSNENMACLTRQHFHRGNRTVRALSRDHFDAAAIELDKRPTKHRAGSNPANASTGYSQRRRAH